jgi:hypothetical protein
LLVRIDQKKNHKGVFDLLIEMFFAIEIPVRNENDALCLLPTFYLAITIYTYIAI